MVEFIDKDMGFERVKIELKQLEGRSVKVGIWGDESVEGTSVVDYAVYNEFGTVHIPARPFMGTTYATYMPRMLQFIEFLAGQIVEGRNNATHVLKVIGEQYQAAVQKTIRDAKNWAVPNTPETIKAKGSSSPLIDTGRMIGSVRYEIE